LTAACNNDRSACAEALEAENVDVNQALKNGRTSIWWALHNQNLKLVQLLVEHGANVDLPPTNLRSAIVAWIEDYEDSDASKIAFYIADASYANNDQGTGPPGDYSDLAIRACDKDQSKVLDLLLMFGMHPDVRLPRHKGSSSSSCSCSCVESEPAALTLGFDTLLHRVARNGDTPNGEAMVKKLLQCKSDVNAEGEHGQTPLSCAIEAHAHGIQGVLFDNDGTEGKGALRPPTNRLLQMLSCGMAGNA